MGLHHYTKPNPTDQKPSVLPLSPTGSITVVGVGTRARNQVYAILATTTPALLETRHFPPLGPESNRAINRMARRTGLDRIQQDVIVMHEEATAACAVFDEP